MSLQMNQTNRRKFLERSMLGFGGALLLPSLLESCIRDHNLPNPDPGLGTPNDLSDIDWQSDARSAVIFGVGKIPAAGGILSGLTKAVWSDPKNGTWQKVRNDVESLMEAKIADSVYNNAMDLMGGLKPTPTGLVGDVFEYMNMLRVGGADSPLIPGQWHSVHTTFMTIQKFFQKENYEVLLLPLFTHFANMYLALLRDGAINEQKWGISNYGINIAKLLPDTIQAYEDYVDAWVKDGRNQITKIANSRQTANNDHRRVEPFNTINQYNRQMTLNVLDYRNVWDYYDYNKYPNGVKGLDGLPIKASELLSREIYSDPYGSTWVDYLGNQKTTPIPVPSPLGGAPTAFPTQISIWSGDRVDAVEVIYPQGSGPNGITQTPRMGGPGGNISTISYDLNNPITKFRVATNKVTAYPTNPIIMLLQFADSLNKPTKAYGTDNTPVDYWGWINFPEQAVSSVYVNGNFVSKWPSDANCVVVGFKYWDSPTATLKVVRNEYITNPLEMSLEFLRRYFPGVAIPDGFISEELKGERLAYWT